MAVVVIAEAQVEHILRKAHQIGETYGLNDLVADAEAGCRPNMRAYYTTGIDVIVGFIERAKRGEEPVSLLAEFWSTARKDAH